VKNEDLTKGLLMGDPTQVRIKLIKHNRIGYNINKIRFLSIVMDSFDFKRRINRCQR